MHLKGSLFGQGPPQQFRSVSGLAKKDWPGFSALFRPLETAAAVADGPDQPRFCSGKNSPLHTLHRDAAGLLAQGEASLVPAIAGVEAGLFCTVPEAGQACAKPSTRA